MIDVLNSLADSKIVLNDEQLLQLSMQDSSEIVLAHQIEEKRQ